MSIAVWKVNCAARAERGWKLGDSWIGRLEASSAPERLLAIRQRTKARCGSLTRHKDAKPDRTKMIRQWPIAADECR